jgi:sigma-B regulation protein RsbU (phosphoserine phosphatase)
MSSETLPDVDALRLGQDLFRFLLENTQDQIYFKDRRGRFLRVSRAVAELFGVKDPDQLIGKSDFDFWSAETAQAAFADEQRIIETGQPLVGKIEKLVYRDGRVRWDYTSKLPLRNSNGEIIGICGINKDFTLIKEMEDALARSNMELEARNARLHADLRTAREIQVALLPRDYVPIGSDRATGGNALAFAYCYRPAAAVGGDFFHIFPLSRGRAGIFICDVMGHGLRAALVTAIIRACLEELRPLMRNPGRLLSGLNRRLRAILEHVEEPFIATAFYMIADPARKEVRFANAGHPAPVRLRHREGSVEMLAKQGRKRGCALGLLNEATFSTARLPFEQDDRIILFTDGLYEVESPQGDEFGLRSLIESFRAHAHLPVQALFEAVLADVSQFSSGKDFADDVCMVAVEQTSSAGPSIVAC